MERFVRGGRTDASGEGTVESSLVLLIVAPVPEELRTDLCPRRRACPSAAGSRSGNVGTGGPLPLRQVQPRLRPEARGTRAHMGIVVWRGCPWSRSPTPVTKPAMPEPVTAGPTPEPVTPEQVVPRVPATPVTPEPATANGKDEG